MGFLRAWQVQCPVCEAKPHKPCRQVFGWSRHSLGVRVHQSRIEKARSRAEEEPARNGVVLQGSL